MSLLLKLLRGPFGPSKAWRPLEVVLVSTYVGCSSACIQIYIINCYMYRNLIIFGPFRCYKYLNNWRYYLSFLGHVCRKESLEYLVTTGKFDGKRDRGRQRQGYVASLKRRVGLSWTDNVLMHSTKDRELWGTMIVNVVGHDT